MKKTELKLSYPEINVINNSLHSMFSRHSKHWSEETKTLISELIIKVHKKQDAFLKKQ